MVSSGTVGDGRVGREGWTTVAVLAGTRAGSCTCVGGAQNVPGGSGAVFVWRCQRRRLAGGAHLTSTAGCDQYREAGSAAITAGIRDMATGRRRGEGRRGERGEAGRDGRRMRGIQSSLHIEHDDDNRDGQQAKWCGTDMKILMVIGTEQCQNNPNAMKIKLDVHCRVIQTRNWNFVRQLATGSRHVRRVPT